MSEAYPVHPGGRIGRLILYYVGGRTARLILSACADRCCAVVTRPTLLPLCLFVFTLYVNAVMFVDFVFRLCSLVFS